MLQIPRVKKLDVGFSTTTKQWKEMFSSSRYWRAGAMYRYIAPVQAQSHHSVPNQSSNIMFMEVCFSKFSIRTPLHNSSVKSSMTGCYRAINYWSNSDFNTAIVIQSSNTYIQSSNTHIQQTGKISVHLYENLLWSQTVATRYQTWPYRPFCHLNRLQILVEIIEVRNLYSNHKGKLVLSVSKMQNDMLFKGKSHISICMETEETQAVMFQCEPKGQCLFELVDDSSKSFGTCSISVMELDSKLPTPKWLEFDSGILL